MLGPGQQVGNYVLVRQLGAGGMGTVFEARHQQIGRRAAIKVLHPELSGNPACVRRFLNEARAVNLVGHPGLVEVVEFGQQDDGTAYLVMELLAGESLHQRLLRAGRLPPPEALPLGRRIALAMQAAHERGIVHRDLKPGNIMLVPDPARTATGSAGWSGTEQVKVLDFGVAKLEEELVKATPALQQGTRSGVVLGTPEYMAPEQCAGATRAGPPADVYALGVMLYEMLAGQRPFRCETAVETMVLHMRQDPPPLRELAPTLSGGLVALVHRMLVKSPVDRPSMREVAEQLLQLAATVSEMAGQGPAALATAGEAQGFGPAPAGGRSWRRRARRALAAAVVIGALLLGAGMDFILRRSVPAPRSAVRSAGPVPVQQVVLQQPAPALHPALPPLQAAPPGSRRPAASRRIHDPGPAERTREAPGLEERPPRFADKEPDER